MLTGGRPIEILRSSKEQYNVQKDGTTSVYYPRRYSKSGELTVYFKNKIWRKYFNRIIEEREQSPEKLKSNRLLTNVYVRNDEVVAKAYTQQIYRPTWTAVKKHFGLTGRMYCPLPLN